MDDQYYKNYPPTSPTKFEFNEIEKIHEMFFFYEINELLSNLHKEKMFTMKRSALKA